jgi:hypothetical protein
MEIRTNLPFKHCEKCPEFILSVDDKVLYFSSGYTERVIDVRCKNANLCKRLDAVRTVGEDESPVP